MVFWKLLNLVVCIENFLLLVYDVNSHAVSINGGFTSVNEFLS